MCYIGFTSSSSKPIAKLKKRVGQSKPSNTQANPIEIEEAKEEVSMHKEEIVFTDESKKQGSSIAFEGGHSFNDLLESEDGHFSAGQGSIGQNPPTLLLPIPQVNILPLFSLIFINFYFRYLCFSQVSP